MRFTMAAVLIALAGIVWLSQGTLDPCGMIRSRIREDARRAGAIEVLTTMLPDSVIDAVVEAKFGQMTPGRCIVWLLDPASFNPYHEALAASHVVAPAPLPARPGTASHMPTAAALQLAQARSQVAINACRDKRIRGELPSYVSSVECSGLGIVEAYRDAQYPFMDLVYRWLDDRRALGDQLDRGLLTKDQADRFEAQLLAKFRQVEAQRVSGTQ